MSKWVRVFGVGESEPKGDEEALGLRGARLARMAAAGVPVPPGFTLLRPALEVLSEPASTWSPHILTDIAKALAVVDARMKALRGQDWPTLFSVRVDGPRRIVGLMPSVLNVGANDAVMERFAALTGDRRFALDCHRRFIAAYADAVHEIDHDVLQDIIGERKDARDITSDFDLDADDLEAIISAFRAHLTPARLPPDDLLAQLRCLAATVARSWNGDHPKLYRRHNNIADAFDMRVQVQAMVFGNLGATSGTGVLFSRDPHNGAPLVYGEFLPNGQGDDVISGIRTPAALSRAAREALGETAPSLEEISPKTYEEICASLVTLESLSRDMVDVEFTVERGRLWFLDAGPGKRTAQAAVKIARDFHDAGLIDAQIVLERIDPDAYQTLLQDYLLNEGDLKALAHGLPGSRGVATGAAVWDESAALEYARDRRPFIFIRDEVCPDDIPHMHASAGIVTLRGGMTSHAAVVARGMGRPCVTGAGDLILRGDVLRSRHGEIKRGDTLTIDGDRGLVFAGKGELSGARFSEDARYVLRLAEGRHAIRLHPTLRDLEGARICAELQTPRALVRIDATALFFADDNIGDALDVVCAETPIERRRAFERLGEALEHCIVSLLGLGGAAEIILSIDRPEPTWEYWQARANAASLGARRDLRGIDARTIERRLAGCFGPRLVVTNPEFCQVQLAAVRRAIETKDARARLAVSGVISPLDVEATRNWINTPGASPIAVGAIVDTQGVLWSPRTMDAAADFVILDIDGLQASMLPGPREILEVYEDLGGLPVSDRFDLETAGAMLRACAPGWRRHDRALGVIASKGLDAAEFDFIVSLAPDDVFVSAQRVPWTAIVLTRLRDGRPA